MSTPEQQHPGVGTYTTTSPVLVHAVRLTEDADWDAIATWCGGEHHVERDISDEYVSYLMVPGPDDTGPAIASHGDWIIRGVTGLFFVKLPDEFAATYTPHTDQGTASTTVQDAALKLIRKGYFDPGATVPREHDQGPEKDETEPVWAWGARAALANLVNAGLLPERLFGDVPRLEMFARQRAEGWDSWGNQVPDEEATDLFTAPVGDVS